MENGFFDVKQKISDRFPIGRSKFCNLLYTTTYVAQTFIQDGT